MATFKIDGGNYTPIQSPTAAPGSVRPSNQPVNNPTITPQPTYSSIPSGGGTTGNASDPNSNFSINSFSPFKNNGQYDQSVYDQANSLVGVVNPQIQAINDTLTGAKGSYDRGVAIADSNYNLGTTEANTQSSYDLNKIYNQMQGNNIDVANLGIDVAANSRQQELDKQLYGNQVSQFKLNEQSLDYQDLGNQQQRDVNQRGELSREAMSGIGGLSSGQNYIRKDIQDQFDLARKNIENARQGLKISENTAAKQHDESQAGFEDTAKKEKLQQEKYDLLGKDLGLDAQNVKDRLTTALQKLGLDKQITVEDLTQQLITSRQNGISSMGPIIQAISSMTGIK